MLAGSVLTTRYPLGDDRRIGPASKRISAALSQVHRFPALLACCNRAARTVSIGVEGLINWDKQVEKRG